VEEQDGTFRAWEFKWNPGAKARLSKTFANAYQNSDFKVIIPRNVEDFLFEKEPVKS
jgi:hypothetical protein